MKQWVVSTWRRTVVVPVINESHLARLLVRPTQQTVALHAEVVRPVQVAHHRDFTFQSLDLESSLQGQVNVENALNHFNV